MAKLGYCSNGLYRQLMCTHCKNDCAIPGPPCIIPKKDSSCSDKIKNCESSVFLCDFNLYTTIMLKTCPSTCGNCSGKQLSTTTISTTTSVNGSLVNSTTTTKKP
uniref:ShKT domain-containing protein n=1 Tax=Strongyloides stercoralis TaxID=6248 RepID=A0A0K0E6N4_STRER